MSLLNEERTLDRITVAPIESPIAVFKTDIIDRRGRRLYDSFFGCTISAKIYIKTHPTIFIGNFDKHMNKNDIMHAMRTK